MTLASGDYRSGAMVLSSGLRSQLAEEVEVVVFCDEEISLMPGVTLRSLSELPKVDVPDWVGEPLMANFGFCWRKLGLWALEEYEIVIYLDSDILILNDVKPLPNLVPPQGMLAAVPACECWRSELCNYTSPKQNDDDVYFNAGVLAFRPSLSVFKKMMDWLKNGPSGVTAGDGSGPMPFAEQDFLNLFFQKKFSRLPAIYNALQHAMRNPKHQAALTTKNCVALHYLMGKPWAPTKLEEDFADLQSLWHAARKKFASHAFLRPTWKLHRVHEKLPLFLVREYITPETEASLLSVIYGDSLKDRWVQLQKRELLCLGGVPHPDGAICEALPPAIKELGHGLAEAGAMSMPNQCLINKYLPGQGIDAHSDGPKFASEVAILTLEGPALMYFGLVEKKVYPSLPPRLEVLLEPRSLLLITGEAYELYVHRIDHIHVDETQSGHRVARAPRRTSLTLRRLKDVQLSSEEVDEVAEGARKAQWKWWNSQISEID